MSENEKKPVHTMMDQSKTMEVDNHELEELLVSYASQQNIDLLNQLAHTLARSRVLVPAQLDDQKRPTLAVLRTPSGETVIPIYTGKQQIPNAPKAQAIVNMPFIAVNEIAVAHEDCTGIVVNPFSNNLILRQTLLKKLHEGERVRVQAIKAAREGGGKITMTGEQYAIFERKQFELRFFPKQFFENGAEMIQELCDKKETCVDELFEKSYQQPRLYPYLTEEFSVMALDISETLRVIRIDMPGRDTSIGSCERLFLTWDTTTETGRYFTIEHTDKGKKLGEVTKDWKHLLLGDAPEDGAELNEILTRVGAN